MMVESIVSTQDGRKVTISGDPQDVDRITAIMQAVGPDTDIEKLKRLMSQYETWARMSPEPVEQLQFVTVDGASVSLTRCDEEASAR